MIYFNFERFIFLPITLPKFFYRFEIVSFHNFKK